MLVSRARACTRTTQLGLVYEGADSLSGRSLSVSKFVTHVISRPSGLASCSVVCSWISATPAQTREGASAHVSIGRPTAPVARSSRWPAQQRSSPQGAHCGPASAAATIALGALAGAAAVVRAVVSYPRVAAQEDSIVDGMEALRNSTILVAARTVLPSLLVPLEPRFLEISVHGRGYVAATGNELVTRTGRRASKRATGIALREGGCHLGGRVAERTRRVDVVAQVEGRRREDLFLVRRRRVRVDDHRSSGFSGNVRLEELCVLRGERLAANEGGEVGARASARIGGHDRDEGRCFSSPFQNFKFDHGET